MRPNAGLERKHAHYRDNSDAPRMLYRLLGGERMADELHASRESHPDTQILLHRGSDSKDVPADGEIGNIDTEAGMLSGISRKHSIRSNPCWFTEFCNSQRLSHFAAPFIVVRAEASVAESCGL